MIPFVFFYSEIKASIMGSIVIYFKKANPRYSFQDTEYDLTTKSELTAY